MIAFGKSLTTVLKVPDRLTRCVSGMSDAIDITPKPLPVSASVSIAAPLLTKAVLTLVPPEATTRTLGLLMCSSPVTCEFVRYMEFLPPPVMYTLPSTATLSRVTLPSPTPSVMNKSPLTTMLFNFALAVLTTTLLAEILAYSIFLLATSPAVESSHITISARVSSPSGLKALPCQSNI